MFPLLELLFMVKETTNGITVNVRAQYQLENSMPWLNRYLFSYNIVIENGSDKTVQLISRHWHIINGIGEVKEVVGEGVVGLQPIIEPGYAFQYDSYCLLPTAIGRMYGTYQLVHPDGKIEGFDIQIPEFKLEAITIQN